MRNELRGHYLLLEERISEYATGRWYVLFKHRGLYLTSDSSQTYARRA